MEKTNKIIDQVKQSSSEIDFAEVIDAVDSDWDYTPTSFTNGEIVNDAGTNEGSCKILALAKHFELNQDQTVALFGHYYRDDVLGNPDGDDHGNIRNFMKTGWDGVSFENPPLTPRA